MSRPWIARDLARYLARNLARRALGFTTLLQPQKPVTPAEAAATLWYFGTQGQGISVGDRLAAQDQP